MFNMCMLISLLCSIIAFPLSFTGGDKLSDKNGARFWPNTSDSVGSYTFRYYPGGGDLWTSGLQISAGISMNAARWDKHLGDLTDFFDAADLVRFPHPRLSGMPCWAVEANYYRDFDARLTWKAGLLYDQQTIQFFNDTYKDTASAKFQQAGAQAFAVLSISPRSRRFAYKFTLQPGLIYQRLFSGTTSLGHLEADSINTIPGLPYKSAYDLGLNTVNNNYLAAAARIEMLFGNRRGRIMYSAAVEARFSLIKNYQYSSMIRAENSPNAITSNSSPFGMPAVTLSFGLIYKFSSSQIRKPVEIKKQE